MGPAERKDWRGEVLYQIYPRSFADSNGDGVGDLRGIIEKLDYVSSLGVDGIWISPVFRSPMEDFGYDISDYRDIDPLFGTLADFDDLVEQCRQRGLRLLVDQVLSHSSSAHPWFLESRSSRNNLRADWYVWADAREDGGPPNNWLSVFGGSAWEWEPRRRQYYLHNFLASQPDLNFHNPQVQQAVLDDVGFWLARGAGGVRLDVCNFYFHDRALRDDPPRANLQGICAADRPVNPYDWQLHENSRNQPEAIGFFRRLRGLAESFPDRVLMGEIGDIRGADTIIDYTRGADRLHMAYSFDLLGNRHDAAHLRDLLSRFEGAAGQGWACWPVSNHDTIRVATRWGVPDERTAPLLLAALLQLCLRGTPCIYMGDELGLPQAELPYEALRDPVGRRLWPEDKGRDGCRTPMPWRAEGLAAGFSAAEPWLPVDPRHYALSVERQEGDGGSVLHAYRALIAWRRRQPELATGGFRLLPADPAVLGFLRDGLVCLFNLSPSSTRFELPDDAPLSPVAVPAVQAGTFDNGTANLPGWSAWIGRRQGHQP